jgi:protoheme IX farnesyltransferase
MLPNVAGEKATKVQILAYSVILVATSLIPSFIGMSGWLYTAVAATTGISFVYLAARLFRTTENTAMKKVARSLFTYSLSYLAVIFFALMTDRVAQLAGWVA